MCRPPSSLLVPPANVFRSRGRQTTLRRVFRIAAAGAFAASVLAGGANGQGPGPPPSCNPTPSGGNLCLLSNTQQNRDKALDVGSGGTVLEVANDIFSNSSHASNSVYFAAGTVSARAIGAVGGAHRASGANVTPWPPDANLGAGARQGDPFAAAPFNGDCTGGSPSSFTATGNDVTYTRGPGTAFPDTTYNNLGAKDRATLVLKPGVYTIRGELKIEGTGSFIADGVTLLFCPGASLSLEGAGAVRITAPGGPTDFAIFYARNNTNDLNIRKPDVATNPIQITGRIYAASARLYVANAHMNVKGDVVVDRAFFSSSANVKILGEPRVYGSLTVKKTITGSAADEHGDISFDVSCGNGALSPFEIAEGAGEGTFSQTYNDIPAGTTCFITEIANGSTSTVRVVIEGGTSTVITANGTTTIALTNTYSHITVETGALRVTKVIRGPAAAAHGRIRLGVTCDDVDLGEFVIPAGAGSRSQTYRGIPAGTTCAVEEIADGSIAGSVHVVITGGKTADITANELATIQLTDNYTHITPATGALRVTKTITGDAAADHGRIRIEVTCRGIGPLPDFVIAAGAGATSHTYRGIPAGTTCTVNEIVNGSTSTVQVVIRGNRQATVPGGGTGVIDLTDTYTHVPAPTGALVVTKTITGAAAADHGRIRITVTCGDQELDDFVIAAGAGTSSRTYRGIPADTTCTVEELANGSTSTVHVVVRGNRETTIPAGGTGTIHLTDTYTHVAPETGALRVTKTIAGAGAGSHGRIRIEVTCGGVALPDFVIAAGAGTTSRTYRGIPAGTRCSVNELNDGSTSGVDVVITGGRTAVIAANGVATIDLTDTYTNVPDTGSLVVTKTIAGAAAGQQGVVVIEVTCGNERLLPDFVIRAGTPAGSQTRRWDRIPAGTRCTVIETANGATSTVAVVVTGSGTSTVVPAGGTANLAVTNTYSSDPGTLVVNKTITGSAAGQQGAITIQVVCNGTALPDFTIPAGAPAGTTSRTYSGLAAGATCTITETANGQTSTVNVIVTGGGQVTIPNNGGATANLVDTYTPANGATGSLRVEKTIAGAGAGSQGVVTIAVICDGTPLPDFVIPAGTAAGTSSRIYTPIAAGSTCTVTETADGHTSTVDVVVRGDGQTVTIPSGGTATASFTDTYTRIPGSLTVYKTITGSGAGFQGAIRIAVTCNGTSLPDFFIYAHTVAGTVWHRFDGIPAGASCTVSEAAGGNSQQASIPANDVATVRLTDSFGEVGPRLSVRKTASATRVVGGSTVKFTLVVTNRGSDTASNIRFCDDLPRQLVFLSLAGGHLVNGNACWTIPSLAPGASRSFTVRTQSFRTSVARRVCNRAIAQADGVRASGTACIRVLASRGRPGGVTG